MRQVKRYADWKGRNKTTFICKHGYLFIERAKRINFLKLSDCTMVLGYMINIQMSIVFLYKEREISGICNENTMPFTLTPSK